MLRFDPTKSPVGQIFDLLNGAIAPRPIALVSTRSKSGQSNLAPFSFFNAFGANPPMVGFSASRRVRDATLKDTWRNLMDTGECVIHAVTWPMVQQASLASTEYPSEVDEFVKSGFTPIPAERVSPARVAESPLQMECVLKQMLALGDGPGSGNLALCEVVLFHLAEDLYTEGAVDNERMDLVGRLGGSTYVRASGGALFQLAKPVRRRGIGYDQLPGWVRASKCLTANDLAQLANVEEGDLPTEEQARALARALSREGLAEPNSLEAFARAERLGRARELLARAQYFFAENRGAESLPLFERAAKCALESGEPLLAWSALRCAEKVVTTRAPLATSA